MGDRHKNIKPIYDLVGVTQNRDFEEISIFESLFFQYNTLNYITEFIPLFSFL